MYSWYPKRLYPQIPDAEKHIDIDELIPDIPKASGERKYRPQLRPTFHRTDAIEEIIDEYVPPPDPVEIKRKMTQEPVPYEKKYWITEENVSPSTCSCCSYINQTSSRFRANCQINNVRDSYHVFKSGNKIDDFVKAYLSEEKASRLPGILVTERPLGRYHVHSDGDIHYHDPTSPRTYRSHLHGELVNSELYEAEDRFQKAESRLQSFINRSATSPPPVGKVPFPGAKLSVRFAKVPMRYIYTPPYDYYD